MLTFFAGMQLRPARACNRLPGWMDIGEDRRAAPRVDVLPVGVLKRVGARALLHGLHGFHRCHHSETRLLDCG